MCRRRPRKLPPIISAQGLLKRYGVAPLFQNISFTVSEGDRIGVIGPNGSGKSTLLEMLIGSIKPDSGDVAIRKGTRLSCVAQISEFATGVTIRSVIEKALERSAVPEAERASRFAETLGRAGFADLDVHPAMLSGGWRTRLAIAEALVQAPDILLLDEPTNHLDLAGIQWLESVLRNAAFACVVVSHDRYFLENAANEMVELNRAYPDGAFRVGGNYSAFLEAKEEYLHTQKKRQESLENRVHTELEWLRRGPKARATKAKARIDRAHEMIGELAEMNARSRTASAEFDFSATNRQSKQLITLEGVSYGVGSCTLFKDLQFSVTSGMRVGLVGPNGSGKTTLLRLMRGDIKPESGKIHRAEGWRVVYFDQNRELEPDITLRRALAPDSDAVIYQDRVIHVASWAERFLFSSENLNQRVGQLSGGERARVLIAQLMLQPADVLLLDEPTNDLDIPTLEVLEESLLEFPGALVLVTHDRYLLDRVSTQILALDGAGGATTYMDYAQWETGRGQAHEKAAGAGVVGKARRGPRRTATAEERGHLSYRERREWEQMEERILEAERRLESCRQAAADPAVASDHQELSARLGALAAVQAEVDSLYAR